jgi:RHS repeat-associated protein
VVFSGGTSVQEWDNNGTTEYIRGSDWGGGVGGLLYSLRPGQPIGFTHYNHRGDVVAKTDGAGTLTWQAKYEGFGTRRGEWGTTPDRQKANTKEEDPSGLLLEGHRYRDLETGVFMTKDPAGFVDGPNLYAYVRQNPWSKFDPEGLYSLQEFGNDADAFLGGTVQGLGEANGGSTAYRPSSAPKLYRAGLAVGHALGVGQGYAETQIGGGMIKGGAGLMGTGAAATVGTGGVATPVSVPAAVGGGALVVGGVAVTVHGTLVGANAGQLLAKDAADAFNSSPQPSSGGSSPEGPSAKKIKEIGNGREEVTDQQLKQEYPGQPVQRERMLRDADGKKVIDPVTGEGRRVDHAVIDREANTAKTFETTGTNVDKRLQLQKEERIRQQGGTYIRDKETRQLVPVEGTSEVRRQP